MKKTYINPETTVVMLNTVQPLLISSPGYGGGGGGGVADAPELPGMPDLPGGSHGDIMDLLFK